MSLSLEALFRIDEFYAYARLCNKGIVGARTREISGVYRRKHPHDPRGPDCCWVEAKDKEGTLLYPICRWDDYKNFLHGKITLDQIRKL